MVKFSVYRGPSGPACRDAFDWVFRVKFADGVCVFPRPLVLESDRASSLLL